MSYLKYEKNLYELNNEQEEIIKKQIQRGGRINIGKELLFAGKCEVVNDLPHNKDEYNIKFLNLRLEGNDYFSEISQKHSEDMKRWLSQTPEQKTDRQWECIAKTKYLLRNKWKESNPQRVEMIKARILAWFQEKNEAWCPSEVYEDLLPPAQGVVPGSGFQRIGELITV